MTAKLPDAFEAFASDNEPAKWFPVAVQDHGTLPSCAERKIIFHGVNKSGSLCLSKVVMDAYEAAGRANQFHSHYHTRGVTLEGFIGRLQGEPPPAFFVGHYLFNSVRPEDKNLVFLTQFRHPLPRLMSCYEWLRKRHVVEKGTDEGFPRFEEFISNGRGKSHSQVIQFAAKYPEQRTHLQRSCSAQELFERSIANIEQYVAFVGIAELFEETIFTVAHLCGLEKVPAWKKDQRNAGRPMAWTLPQSALDLVHEVYRYDFDLYDWAKRRFEKTLSALSFGPELQAYQAHCQGQYKDRLLRTDVSDPRLLNA